MGGDDGEDDNGGVVEPRAVVSVVEEFCKNRSLSNFRNRCEWILILFVLSTPTLLAQLSQ